MRITKTLLLLSLTSFALRAIASKTKANDLLGFWLSEEKNAVIQVERNDDTFSGKIVWLVDVHTGKIKDKLDTENPDKDKRARSLMGLKILEGFTYDDGRWSGGTIYDAKSGKTYSAKMKLEDPNTLNLRGFVGISLFGRTSKWTREKSKVPAKYSEN